MEKTLESYSYLVSLAESSRLKDLERVGERLKAREGVEVTATGERGICFRSELTKRNIYDVLGLSEKDVLIGYIWD